MLVGSLLGDFWRGASDPAWSPALTAGLRLHRRIDSFTDAHPAVADARRLFDPPFRRYAGILIDIWFDHLLAVEFASLCERPLREFADHVYAVISTSDAPLPPAFELFAARMRHFDMLYGYRERERIDGVYARVAERLSRANPIAHAMPIMESLEAPLGRAFEQLWGDLALLRGLR